MLGQLGYLRPDARTPDPCATVGLRLPGGPSLLGFGSLSFRTERSKQVELVILRHEVAVLCRQLVVTRPLGHWASTRLAVSLSGKAAGSRPRASAVGAGHRWCSGDLGR